MILTNNTLHSQFHCQFLPGAIKAASVLNSASMFFYQCDFSTFGLSFLKKMTIPALPSTGSVSFPFSCSKLTVGSPTMVLQVIAWLLTYHHSVPTTTIRLLFDLFTFGLFSTMLRQSVVAQRAVIANCGRQRKCFVTNAQQPYNFPSPVTQPLPTLSVSPAMPFYTFPPKAMMLVLTTYFLPT